LAVGAVTPPLGIPLEAGLLASKPLLSTGEKASLGGRGGIRF